MTIKGVQVSAVSSRFRPDQATKMLGAVYRLRGGGRRCLGQNRSCIVVSELGKMGGSKTWQFHRLVLSPLHYRGGHRRRCPSLSPSHYCRLLVGAELRLQVLGRRDVVTPHAQCDLDNSVINMRETIERKKSMRTCMRFEWHSFSTRSRSTA